MVKSSPAIPSHLPACRMQSANASLPGKQQQQFYPGDLSQVDEIRIRSGSTGALRTYTDKQQIQQWLNSIRDITFTASPARERGVGYLYDVYLWEQGKQQLTFNTISIGDHYFTESSMLQSSIEDLYLLPAPQAGYNPKT